ncbi:hypothetical protein BpHYR1_046570 [Brachionus plicatilis]|uniref:Uncharacterized protein n=1 Tax=Brachionus plicatilis TaxID=10195 RepID=A0A3M7QJV5_BRAPC|nr:hypothetical protein BpHYR1_046570 [Brachionus plicatilis]
MSQKAKTIYRIICCYSDPLILRNFDKISDIATSFSLVFARDSEPDASIINHRNDDVCPWSQKIIDLLSDVQVSGEAKRKNEALINHLMTIKALEEKFIQKMFIK